MRSTLILCALFSLTLSIFVPPSDNQLGSKRFCGICKDLVGFAEKHGGNQLEKYLDHKVDEVCKAAAFLEKECKNELHRLVGRLVQEINKNASADACCHAVGLC